MRVLGLLASLVITATTVIATTATAAAPAATTGSVPADIKTILDKPRYNGAMWGLRVLDGKNVLVDYNSDQKFFIGSVRKVFTVGQLLEAIGPAHTFDTPVYRAGAVANGTLTGNLIVVASGDLTMGDQRLGSQRSRLARQRDSHQTRSASGLRVARQASQSSGHHARHRRRRHRRPPLPAVWVPRGVQRASDLYQRRRRRRDDYAGR
jgi:D-alanyl-D-alanine carboxypeptidase